MVRERVSVRKVRGLRRDGLDVYEPPGGGIVTVGGRP